MLKSLFLLFSIQILLFPIFINLANATTKSSSSTTKRSSANATKHHKEFELPHRLIKNNFFTPHETEIFREYALLKESEYTENWGTKGWFTLGMSSAMNMEYCKKEPLNRNLTAAEIKEKHLYRQCLKLFEKMKKKAELYFNASLAFYQVTFSIRRPIPQPYKMTFSKMGDVQFAQYPHVDNCKFVSDKRGTYCIPSKFRMGNVDSDYYYGYIDYTSLIYINELGDGGGDLMFLDLPKPITWRGLDMDPDIHPEKARCESKNWIDCQYFYREAKGVRISPGPGKLALFDSGPRNIHSVLQLGNETRLTLTILYTHMEKVDRDNLPPQHLSAFYYSTKQCYNYAETPENYPPPQKPAANSHPSSGSKSKHKSSHVATAPPVAEKEQVEEESGKRQLQILATKSLNLQETRRKAEC